MNTKQSANPENRLASKMRIVLWGGWIALYQDLRKIMEVDFRAKYPKPIIALLLFMVPAGLFWWIYVPIHEFLHVIGCRLGGGTVTQLEIDEFYGGAFFARIFSFVTPGSEYAGRLSGFDPGSDFGYLLTDFLPFALSLLFGVPLLRYALKRQSLPLLGSGVILAMAPFLNLPGDYYEMGSILSTRIFSVFYRNPEAWIAMAKLRSDDIVKLIGELRFNPAYIRFGLPVSMLVIALGSLLGLFLAGLTYLGSHRIERFLDSRRLRRQN